MRESEAFCNAASILNIGWSAAGAFPLACMLWKQLQSCAEQLAAFL